MYVNKDIFILDFIEMTDGYYKVKYSVHKRDIIFNYNSPNETWVSVDTKIKVFNTVSEYYDWINKCKEKGYSIVYAYKTRPVTHS